MGCGASGVVGTVEWRGVSVLGWMGVTRCNGLGKNTTEWERQEEQGRQGGVRWSRVDGWGRNTSGLGVVWRGPRAEFSPFSFSYRVVSSSPTTHATTDDFTQSIFVHKKPFTASAIHFADSI